jgi:putative transposase
MIISEETKLKRKLSRLATKAKRKEQDCRVIELKLIESKFNQITRELINRYFVEAKWLWNHIIGDDLIGKGLINKPIHQVPVRYPDKSTGEYIEIIKDLILPAQCKLALREQIQSNIKGLKTTKSKGKKVGMIKCKSEVNSIEFKQYGISYKFQGNRIKLAGIKQPLKVSGIEQLDLNIMSPANSRLVRRPSGLYLLITVWMDKSVSNIRPTKKGHKMKQTKSGRSIGIDLGIKTTIVTSDGEAINIRISETDQLKKLQRRFSRLLRLNKRKRSNNANKINHLIRKEYEHITNQKKDITNKAICYLTSKYDTIVIQDENISGWHKGLFGKQVQHSALGTLKTALKNAGAVVVSRFDATTKECYICGTRNDIKLEDRVFVCECCGHVEERDIKASKTIMMKGGILPDPTPIMEIRSVDLSSPILSKDYNVVPIIGTSSGTDE